MNNLEGRVATARLSSSIIMHSARRPRPSRATLEVHTRLGPIWGPQPARQSSFVRHSSGAVRLRPRPWSRAPSPGSLRPSGGRRASRGVSGERRRLVGHRSGDRDERRRAHDLGQRDAHHRGRSSAARSQLARSAAASYVLWANSVSTSSGDEAVRTASYGRMNSPRPL
jgi:hypothetical protein